MTLSSHSNQAPPPLPTESVSALLHNDFHLGSMVLDSPAGSLERRVGLFLRANRQSIGRLEVPILSPHSAAGSTALLVRPRRSSCTHTVISEDP
jgi:hypothetical protein